jgi:prophage regulatory protein
MLTLLRLPRVIEITGCPRSTIYDAIRAQKFPPPVKIGERAVAWRSTDIEAWVKKAAQVTA